MALDALLEMTASNDENNEKFASLGGVRVVVQVMYTHNRPGHSRRSALIQSQGACLLTFLSFSHANKDLIVAEKGPRLASK
jgi:hypothetical protein